MPKTPKGIFSDKMAFMDKAVVDLKNSYSLAEDWIFDRIIQDVLPELDIEDGFIKPNNKNINIITAKLNVVMSGLRTGQNRDIVQSVLNNMSGITKSNNSYFGISSEISDELFTKAKSRVEVIMRKSLGFNPDGTIKPNSFVDSISNVDAINEQIRETAIRNIQGGNSVKDFTADLAQSIKTDKDGLGVMNRYYNQTINDRYAQYDRAESKSFADELKMQAFIYSGGKVRDTRKFCCQRNGLVFTKEEARHWSGLKWAGKNRGYVPLIDMGGYNCRHSPQWISNKAAIRLRPDLFINEDGLLVSNTRKNGPVLNKCA